MKAASLSTRGLDVHLGDRHVIRDLDLVAPVGEVVGLLGPNGCGKSTVMRTIYRGLRPGGGQILLDDADLLAMPLRDSARRVSALAQDSASDLDFTAWEIVSMGRAPHQRGGRRLTREELDLIDQSMADMEVTHLRDRGILSLSGGERQRVLIARALTQEPELLVLDEPTNHLDVNHQLQLLRLLRRLPCTVLIVLHDLNLAAAVCDRIHLVKEGQIVASGTPAQVVTAPTVRAVFDIDVTIIAHPDTGHPQILHSLPR